MEFAKIAYSACPICYGTMAMQVDNGALTYFCPKCNYKRQENMFDSFNTAFLNGSPIVIVLGNHVEVAKDNSINRLVFTNETVDTLQITEEGILVTKGNASEFISMNQVFSISTSTDSEGTEE